MMMTGNLKQAKHNALSAGFISSSDLPLMRLRLLSEELFMFLPLCAHTLDHFQSLFSSSCRQITSRQIHCCNFVLKCLFCVLSVMFSLFLAAAPPWALLSEYISGEVNAGVSQPPYRSTVALHLSHKATRSSLLLLDLTAQLHPHYKKHFSLLIILKRINDYFMTKKTAG